MMALCGQSVLCRHFDIVIAGCGLSVSCGYIVTVLCGQSKICGHFVMFFCGQSEFCGHFVTLYDSWLGTNIILWTLRD